MIIASRHHDISCGHRVVGHESKCAHLHGHNYRVHFKVCAEAGLDSIGRVIDFSVIKTKLCQWLEETWDHKFLVFEEDVWLMGLFVKVKACPEHAVEFRKILSSFVPVPFNPTAENMAAYLLNFVGPQQLSGTGTRLVNVVIEETRKCSAEISL
jgi:6-pyruvoyltetrahydropterin/6-carboxytetrahydropterin synthase